MKITTVVGLTALILNLELCAQNDLAIQARKHIEEWVETKQFTSKEKSDWRLQKGILESSEEALEAEIAALVEEIDTETIDKEKADDQSIKLSEDKERFEASSKALEVTIGPAEVRLRRLAKTFPQPLIDQLGAELEGLKPVAEGDQPRGLAVRAQNLVSVISKTEKFNASLFLQEETRELASGKEQLVSTLYFGLAIAYAATQDGKLGFVGHPTAEGWKFEERPELGKAIRRMIKIKGEATDIRFIPLPAKITSIKP